MSGTRNLHKVIKSKPTLEGAGVHLNRVFGNNKVSLFDPFLLLDDLRANDPDVYRNGIFIKDKQ